MCQRSPHRTWSGNQEYRVFPLKVPRFPPIVPQVSQRGPIDSPHRSPSVPPSVPPCSRLLRFHPVPDSNQRSHKGNRNEVKGNLTSNRSGASRRWCWRSESTFLRPKASTEFPPHQHIGPPFIPLSPCRWRQGPHGSCIIYGLKAPSIRLRGSALCVRQRIALGHSCNPTSFPATGEQGILGDWTQDCTGFRRFPTWKSRVFPKSWDLCPALFPPTMLIGPMNASSCARFR